MKIIITIIIFASTVFTTFGQGVFTKSINGTVARQKTNVNQNCATYGEQNYVFEGLNYLVDEEPKSVSEKNFENYILSKNPYTFPKTSIDFCIVFQPNVPPCCRKIDIEDTLKMDIKQLDTLTKLVLNYPIFSKVQFYNNEKVKYLVISMSRFKKNPMTISFTTDFRVRKEYTGKK